MKPSTAATGRFFLNTYTPLVSTQAGRLASIEHKLPPFIDGSIRREPDLAQKWPMISCLCRADKFAPHLQVGDYVAYMTCMGQWHEEGNPRPARHRRLTAVLRVEATLDSHEDAAAWYRERGQKLPSNCMVADNPPMDLELSHRMTRFRCAMSDGKLHDTWDKAYQWRAKKFPCVVICKNVLGFLGWNAPTVSNADLISVFGKVPGTQNPGRQPLRLLNCLLSQLKVGPLEL